MFQTELSQKITNLFNEDINYELSESLNFVKIHYVP